MRYELTPNYDSAKSFYHKAYVNVNRDNTRITLISYDTAVCTIDKGKITLLEPYSRTTIRHIKEFLKQNDVLWACNYPGIAADRLTLAALCKLTPERGYDND